MALLSDEVRNRLYQYWRRLERPNKLDRIFVTYRETKLYWLLSMIKADRDYTYAQAREMLTLLYADIYSKSSIFQNRADKLVLDSGSFSKLVGRCHLQIPFLYGDRFIAHNYQTILASRDQDIKNELKEIYQALYNDHNYNLLVNHLCSDQDSYNYSDQDQDQDQDQDHDQNYLTTVIPNQRPVQDNSHDLLETNSSSSAYGDGWLQAIEESQPNGNLSPIYQGSSRERDAGLSSFEWQTPPPSAPPLPEIQHNQLDNDIYQPNQIENEALDEQMDQASADLSSHANNQFENGVYQPNQIENGALNEQMDQASSDWSPYANNQYSLYFFPKTQCHVTNSVQMQQMDVDDDEIPYDYKCHIDLDIMTKPAFIENDATGSRFEYDSLLNWLLHKSETNPYTRERVDRSQVKIDYQLKQEIETFVKEKRKEYQEYHQRHLSENDQYQQTMSLQMQ